MNSSPNQSPNPNNQDTVRELIILLMTLVVTTGIIALLYFFVDTVIFPERLTKNEFLSDQLLDVGFIVLNEESKPIEGVRVQLIFDGAPESKLTDSAGYVQVEIITRKSINVILTKAGFKTKTKIINLEVEKNKTRTFVLERDSSSNTQTASSNTTPSSPTNTQPVYSTPPTPSPVPNPPQQDLYFVTDEAFADLNTTNQRVQALKATGYQNAGAIWIPDYPNLSGKPLYQVYAAKFSDRSSCGSFVKTYRQRKRDAYCFRASLDPRISADRF